MKFLLVLVAVIGLGSAGIASPVKSQRDLNADFEEFLELLPLDKILNIVLSFLDDPEFQQVLEYFFGDEFKNLVIEVETIPEYNDIIDFIDEAGLPVKKWIQGLHDLLGIARTAAKSTRAGGLRGLVDAIKAIIDWDRLEEFYNYKMETSPEFKALFDKVASPEFKAFADALAANRRIQEIAALLTAAGIDVQLIIDLLKDFFNYP